MASEWGGLPPQPPEPQVKDETLGTTRPPNAPLPAPFARHARDLRRIADALDPAPLPARPPAPTALHQVADLTAAGLEYIGLRDHDGQISVQVYLRENWLRWITALGGSPDAAVRVEWPYGDHDWQWRWMTSDGQILVHYIENDPPQAEAETEKS